MEIIAPPKRKAGRPKGSTDKAKLTLNNAKTISSVRHKSKCQICNSPHMKDIELDFVHYIPSSVIAKRYDVNTFHIANHMQIRGLMKTRSRKDFYEFMLRNYDPAKITAENALEAAKQLDRIEHVVDEHTSPSNIQVIYSWPALNGTERPATEDGLRPASDSASLPHES
jgi:regulatory protein YycH of two-component signal transduction system YycFG